MPELLTLIADVDESRPTAPSPPVGYALRVCQSSDLEALGRLYLAAYDPGVACASLAEAVADIGAAFAGDYGALGPAASPLIHHRGAPVAAMLTVRRAPWPDTPDCPFVIELFTDRAHRRRGLARALLAHCRAATHAAGEPALALRVAADNAPARALYASLGFRPWPPSPTPA